MKLKRLLQGLQCDKIVGSKEIEIGGLSSDSRSTAPNHLFIAKKGSSQDGHDFIPKAVENGAVAVVSRLYDPFLPKITQLICPHPEQIEAQLAKNFYENPSEELFVFGVTGTNGKTTTTYLVKHLLDGIGLKCGLAGTVETIAGQKRHFSTLTTHDVLFNQKILREMRGEGCKAASVEVSSHGLDQGRLDGIEFDVALFTNLTPDHLDYHPDMAHYLAAKAKLFSMLEESPKENKCAIVNAEDPASAELLKRCPSARHLTFGLSASADVRAEEIRLSPAGTQFTVRFEKQKAAFRTSLIGRFNVYNLLGAIALGVHRGIELEKMVPLLATFKTVPGRLERVSGFVFVDYAHTEDALRNVLSTIKEIATGRVLVVFGAGGNRDPGRRPGLARAAEALADLAIVTSDNPRKEDPEEICRQILAGFKKSEAVRVELDRKRAIELAIALAQQNDIVLIAGKGHERVQIFANERIAFDDCEVAREALAKAR